MNLSESTSLFDHTHLVYDWREALTPQWIGIGFFLVLITIASSSAINHAKRVKPYPNFPVVSLEEEGLSPTDSWLYRGEDVLKKGRKLHPNGFQIMSATGPRIILPNRFAEEIKKVPEWSFFRSLSLDFFCNYPGLTPIDQGDAHVLIDTTRIKINQATGVIVDDMSDEASWSLKTLFGSSNDWRKSSIKQDMEELVAHVSTRVFLGKRLSRNDEWVDIVKTYANRMIAAVVKMRKQNALLLPITHWFIPECKAVRFQYGKAKKVIENEVKQREIAYQKTIAAGDKPAKLFDSVSWALEMAKGEHVDTTNFQLALALAGIVTTSELTTQCMVALAEHPEFIQPIREEIISVIGSSGWQKTTLYKLRLLDSFVKEVQRLRPGQQVQMRRRTGSKPLTLSTGVVIPPRASVGVSMENMTDPTVYADPERFDAYRFLRLREASDNDSGHQLASLSVDHLGFGYGEHACPGRFFASSEVKILLCHMLLKYDWRLADGAAERVPDVRIETRFQVHADQRLEYRRRQEEIEL